MIFKIMLGPLAVFTLVLACPPAFATHPLATDDTGTQGAGGVEIELSNQTARPTSADTDYRIQSGVSTHVGLHERLDLGLTVFLESARSDLGAWDFGIAPPVADLKWRFWGGPASPSSLALRLDYSPKPLSSISSGGHDVGALLVNCWEFGGASLHLNVGGYARDLGIEETLGTLYGGAALTVPITEKMQAAAEAVYETGPFHGFHAVGGMGGLIWEVGDGKIVSLGAGPMWEAGGRPGWVAAAGFTIALPRGAAEDTLTGAEESRPDMPKGSSSAASR